MIRVLLLLSILLAQAARSAPLDVDAFVGNVSVAPQAEAPAPPRVIVPGATTSVGQITSMAWANGGPACWCGNGGTTSWAGPGAVSDPP